MSGEVPKGYFRIRCVHCQPDTFDEVPLPARAIRSPRALLKSLLSLD